MRNLEHKLGNIEIEDIQQLEVDSSDSFYAEILDAFLTKFSHSFKIKDILEEKRELLVLTLIRKLETMTEGLPKPKSTLKFKGNAGHHMILKFTISFMLLFCVIQCCRTFVTASEFACGNPWT
ncbi:hypothetical protein EON65_23225 [archaeon]|nr:MAG: hypothetical protein EON65_23225 [archaeon]